MMDWLFDFASQNSVLFIFIVMIPYIIALVMSGVYSKYNKINVDSSLTGAQAAERILQSCRLMTSDSASVKVVPLGGVMMNNYCPKDKVVNLDDKLFESSSITAIGLASHECGHAIQDAESFALFRVYSKLLFGVTRIAMLALLMLGLGIISQIVINNFSIEGVSGTIFYLIGLLIYAVVIVFYLLMLPMEINASKRALSMLKESVHLSKKETRYIKKILFMAAIYALIGALSPNTFRGGRQVINYD